MTGILARFAVDRGGFQLKVDLELPAQGVSALFGHSGSGKTTCLRAMAGLEKLPGGFFQVGDQVWQDDQKGIFIPPHQREIGYVFQEASLFPHLSVEKNLEFGYRRMPEHKRQVQPNDVIKLLGLGSLLNRPPQALSGGERQRVAVARALLTSPELLLMDEPLSALDEGLKQEILPYLEQLHQQLSIPVVYVSHASDEVIRLADYLVLLEQGRVVDEGNLSKLMLKHGSDNVFSDGASTLIEGQVSHRQNEYLTDIEFGSLVLRVTQRGLTPGTDIRCRIYASDVSLCLNKPTETSIVNRYPATVVKLEPALKPGEMMATLELAAGQFLLAQVSKYSIYQLGIEVGEHLWAQVKSVAVL